jgi:hypothetical protein
MPIHSSLFKQPGPELNPLRLKVPTPVAIEIYERMTKGGNPTGKWEGREYTSKMNVPLIGLQSSVFIARCRAALLFESQVEPWYVDGVIDPDAAGFHLHFEPGLPSLCGSRYHQGISTGLALTVDHVRTGQRTLTVDELRALCPNCRALVDQTPLL